MLGDDCETAESTEEEWKESSADENGATAQADAATTRSDPSSLVQSLRAEADELLQYKTLAESIQQNAKGESLLKSLRTGFAKAVELGAKPKALIFTESRRTQTYLKGLLEANGYGNRTRNSQFPKLVLYR